MVQYGCRNALHKLSQDFQKRAKGVQGGWMVDIAGGAPPVRKAGSHDARFESETEKERWTYTDGGSKGEHKKAEDGEAK